ncbi:uncharacterized protein LOC106082425 [Stomoxys calcitrans]|uniref:uncharacterized protein LOC106082425 n=1 Tax=Stomoxys calcitrans TaxID=35570 RepID=UPI0027E2747C|nr:uncharacterized protein LOC106082425 [Stomoxys calcitrans]
MGIMMSTTCASSNCDAEDPIDLSFQLCKIMPKELQVISQHELDLECSRMYTLSRGMLNSITKVPRENLLENLGRMLRRESKALNDCFQEIDKRRHDIVSVVTERLSSSGIYTNDDIISDYHVPSTNYENVGRYISSNKNMDNVPETKEHQQQTPETIRPQTDNDVDIDASVDVM